MESHNIENLHRVKGGSSSDAQSYMTQAVFNNMTLTNELHGQ